MAAFRPAVPPSVAERIRHLPPDIKRAIKGAIRALAGEPGRGEPLERELKGLLKFKVRRFRIVYRVDRAARTVNVLAVGHRRTIYEEAAATIRASAARLAPRR